MRPGLLDDIAIERGTDKSSKCHDYAWRYEQRFDELKRGQVRLLEIGIDKGQSLLMWRDYFYHEHTVIVGIDINPPLTLPDVVCLQGSQSDANFLTYVSNCYGPFDIIIDDGSHRNADMQASFNTLFPLLKPGGHYIIEDLYCSWWTNTGRPHFDFGKLIGELNNYGRTSRPSESGFFSPDYPDTTYKLASMEFYPDILFMRKQL